MTTVSKLGLCVVKKMNLADLKIASYNPRKMDDAAYTGLGKSIERFGLMVPIVWNKRSGNIVGGHQRYKCLVEAGEKETDVVVVDLDGQEEVALNITLNNAAIRGKFNQSVMDLLKLTEAKLGSVFGEIRLKELFDSLKMEFKEKIVNPGSGGSGENSGEPKQEPIVVCPKCGSQFRMKSQAVVLDARSGGDSK